MRTAIVLPALLAAVSAALTGAYAQSTQYPVGYGPDPVLPEPVGRALSTVAAEGMRPASKIWLQRKLNQPLRITRQRLSVANWRATASMPNVPLPGTTIAARAFYTFFRVRETSCLTF